MESSSKSPATIVHKALKENGYIIPTHEDDVASFLESVSSHDIPPFPEELKDPQSIFDAKPRMKKTIQLDQEKLNQKTSQFAMAAREGKQMSNSTREKIMKARANAKKKKE